MQAGPVVFCGFHLGKLCSVDSLSRRPIFHSDHWRRCIWAIVAIFFLYYLPTNQKTSFTLPLEGSWELAISARVHSDDLVSCVNKNKSQVNNLRSLQMVRETFNRKEKISGFTLLKWHGRYWCWNKSRPFYAETVNISGPWPFIPLWWRSQTNIFFKISDFQHLQYFFYNFPVMSGQWWGLYSTLIPSVPSTSWAKLLRVNLFNNLRSLNWHAANWSGEIFCLKTF